MLTLLESAVKRDRLMSGFQTTKELLTFSASSNAAHGAASFGQVPVLPWIPRTTAAVMLRLLDFDACIAYVKDEKTEQDEVREQNVSSFPLIF